MAVAIHPGYPWAVATLSAPISLRLPRFPGHCSQNRVSLFVFYLPKAGLALFSRLLQGVSFCLLALFLQSTFFVFNTFWPLLQKQGGGVSRQYGDPILSGGMSLVV